MPLKTPSVLGELVANFNLKNLSFFKVGGSCDLFFSPYDQDDLSNFLKNSDFKITCLGNLSNALISDSGIRGCVINLVKYFNKIEFFEGFVKVGAGVLLPKFINECVKSGLSCLEKLYCVPGTIGGAVYMNAGIPEFDISKVLISFDCIDKNDGEVIILNKDNLNMEYRSGNIPQNLIITSVKLRTFYENVEKLKEIIGKISEKRAKSQPLGKLTCGSAFKNPLGFKAWQLIKESDCDKLAVGDAIVSDMHCNFLINSGNAMASDFYKLIQIIKEKVLKKTGILLEEEIIIMGKY
ncbi:MAG: UDP-N-acetylmuramate dehydrogenase [Holosporales bacterium]|jgi:UDP-N-acetylmuramate dehydrogenase|nr:UDP-N-acetylmuramate dehydrogenase [Holosporales bacterium]